MKNLQSYKIHESLSSARKMAGDRKISPDVFNELVECDPSRTFKYMDLIIHIYSMSKPDIDDITDVIFKYDHLLKKGLVSSNLSKYTNLDEIEDAIADARESNKAGRKKSKSGASKILDTPDFKVIRIDTVEASQLYGSGAKWCISGDDAEDYWQSYVEDMGGVFYFVYIKSEEIVKEIQEEFYQSAIDNYDDDDDATVAMLTNIDNFRKFAIGVTEDDRMQITNAFDVVCTPNHMFFQVTGLNSNIFEWIEN